MASYMLLYGYQESVRWEIMKTSSEHSINTKTIMLVADDPGNREILTEVLSDLGYKVIDEPDGASALSVFNAALYDADAA